MSVHVERLPVVPGLGRHVRHDSRSLAYALPVLPRGAIHSQHWQRRVPIWNQGNLGSCFPSGTHVRMADGSERAIEDVRLGEHVLTAERNLGRVIRTLLRDEDGGLVRLILWGHSHLRMTREHPVLTARGYVPAAELRVGDEVALPRYAPERNHAVLPAQHVTQASHRIVPGNRWQGVPGRRGLNAGAHALPEKIELDASFGRLIGLFLAEGNCDSGKAVWSFSLDEKDTLVAETVSLLRGYGVEPHVREIPAHHGCKVTVHGTAWTRLLSSLCGNGAGLKRLHPELTAGPTEFLAGALSGWLDGDGHVRRDGSREGVTISRDLALGMYDIAQALGRHPVLVRSEPTMNAAAKTRRPRWTLTVASGAGRCREDDRYVWRKVRETRLEDYVGPVYDLTVEGDHSYVAEGIGVHNCTGNAAAGWLGTDDSTRQGLTSLTDGSAVDENLAVKLYSAATKLDDDPQNYPPTDTGSDGLSVAKALQGMGLAQSYSHAFSVDAVFAALQSGPGLLGIPWYESMFDTDGSGHIKVDPRSEVAGGHEIVVARIDVANGAVERVWIDNSWGSSWGVGGSAWFTAAELAGLLAKDGDFTVPVAPALAPPGPSPSPAPSPSPSADSFRDACAAIDPGLVARLDRLAARKRLSLVQYAAWKLAKDEGFR